MEGADVCIADGRGATAVGVPIGTDEYNVKRAMGRVTDRDSDWLARCIAYMPQKQAGALIVIELLG